MNRHTGQEEIEDDDYRESEDEDYNPETAKDSEGSDDSGDEEERKLASTYAQIQGNGLIKSRARRKAAKDAPEKTPAVVGESSVDVDALWAEMNNSGPARPTKAEAKTDQGKESKESKEHPLRDSDMITITRTFKFAGEVKTETKEVPRLSAEGQDYLKEQKLKQEEEAKKELLRGGPRREPAKRKLSLIEEYKLNKAKKINTLEKSRLDWLGFVDKEGIREDLTKHNKAGYLDRQNFLDRVDQKREHDIREQRAKQV